jgi:hypothetical protein
VTERTAASQYVCGWTFDDDCCSKLATAFDSKPDVAQACVDQAAEILYALSGRQFGECEVAVRPCRRSNYESYGWGAWGIGRRWGYGLRWLPVLSGGQWLNISCGFCQSSCSCTEVCEVALPGPVNAVTQVKVDGVVLPSTAYRVDNRRSLVRVDGGTCWPLCQNMNLEADQPGTWEVTYTKGLPLPVAGQVALGSMACELAKACLNDTTCVLPQRVTTIVRQGITMALLDPMDFLVKGRTGIYSVDLWLATVNPKGRPRRAGVFSPDVPLPRITP